MNKRPAYLLPANVKPVKYYISLEPDLENKTFSGHEMIELDILEPVSSVKMHAADLLVYRASLHVEQFTLDIKQDEKEETLELISPVKLQKGHIYLSLDFRGKINDQLCGLYEAKYELPDGQKRSMATTQCEAIDARRIFPCWDEPGVKAPMELHITIPENLSAISNMPVKSTESSRAGAKSIRFEETPPMSAYLFNLQVGEFERVEKTTKHGVLIGVNTTPGKKELGHFALEEAVKVLEYLSDYYGVPYPAKKLDFIAIPDFAAGAMENWGAITSREASLLIDPKNSSAATKERVFVIVAHESAHMWFGDLVTMATWNGLWQNESFASFMELIAASKLHPEWNPDDQFVSGDMLNALTADALRSSRPIHTEITHPDQINEAFDAITYDKGASVLRMFQHFLGFEVFRQGVSSYLKKHSYGNAEPEDLWNALEESSMKPVRYMLDNWVKQIGYPLVSVKKTGGGKGKPAVLKLSQERFLLEPTNEPDGTLWSIPISAIMEGKKEITSVLMEKKEDRIELPGPLGKKWFKLNTEFTGLFRVHYEPKDLLKFKAPIEKRKLSVANRIEILDDVFALTQAGHYTTNLFLEIAASFRDETDYNVWNTLLGRLHAAQRLFAGESYANEFNRFIRELIAPTARNLGWEEKEGEIHQHKLLRGTLLHTLGTRGDEATVKRAREKFAEYLKDPETLHPNIRRAVHGIIAAHGNDKDHETFIELYSKTSLQEEQNRLLGAMGDFSEKELLKKSLEFLISGKVRSQDVYTSLSVFGSNPEGGELTWLFVKENWQAFRKMYEKGKLIRYVILASASFLATFEHERDVRTFFEVNPAPEAERSIRQALEKIRINARWLERDRENLGRWLKNNKKN
ncbi:M1 family metallopeptidase [Candidatus Giovannonibacteria bacterium]|nr:M1 family metallopeptidase [Candidatus Giovannonibacteria bacterium]